MNKNTRANLPAPALTPEQEMIKTRRLHLEEQIWTAQMYLGEAKRECKNHVVIPGRILWSPAKGKIVNTREGELPKDDCFSVSCMVCGEDLGWYCPVNPKGYCEYTHPNFADCKWCGIPEERK